MVTTLEIGLSRSQVLNLFGLKPKTKRMDAVHRVDGDGLLIPLRGLRCIRSPSPKGFGGLHVDVLGRTRATLLHSASLQPEPKGLGNL
jgi:hypothetical protein